MWGLLEVIAWLTFFVLMDALGIFPLWLLVSILAVAMIVLVWFVRRDKASAPEDPDGRLNRASEGFHR